MIINILGNGASLAQYVEDDNLTIACNHLQSDATILASSTIRFHGWTPTPTIVPIKVRNQYWVRAMQYPETLEWVRTDDEEFERPATLMADGWNLYVPASLKTIDTGEVATLWAHLTYPTAQIRVWGFDMLWSDDLVNTQWNEAFKPHHRTNARMMAQRTPQIIARKRRWMCNAPWIEIMKP